MPRLALTSARLLALAGFAAEVTIFLGTFEKHEALTIVGVITSLYLIQYSYGAVSPELVWVAGVLVPIGLAVTLPASALIRKVQQASRAAGHPWSLSSARASCCSSTASSCATSPARPLWRSSSAWR